MQDLTEMIEVFETNCFSESNWYLNAGWVLLAVYTTTYDTVGPAVNNLTVHYVLGWSKQLGNPKHKPSADLPSSITL